MVVRGLRSHFLWDAEAYLRILPIISLWYIGIKAPLGPIIRGLLTSPDYKLKDFIAIMMNGYMKNSSLWREILRLDLTEALNKIEVPYIILQGDTDIVASTQTVKELVAISNNVNLKLHIISDTGHMPGADMMEELMSVLKDTVNCLEQ